MNPAKRILIVDDDEDLRETLRLVIEAEGFEVDVASNGREALDILDRGQGQPCVVILDLLMPLMDGWETLATIRNNHRFDCLPIIICTSAPSQAPRGFPVLPKPVDLDLLLETLSRFCGTGAVRN